MTPLLQSVEAIYGAFGRGDVPAILDHLSPTVAWEAWDDNYAQRAGVPWLMPRHGHAGAVAFFTTVATSMNITGFSVLSMLAGGNQVAAEIRLAATFPNGTVMHEEEIHLWTFGDDGKVVRFRHYTDTAKHIAAAGLSA
jgi:ketosteroid isomerase-like protein